MVRYGCLDWAPTFLKEAQGYDIKQAGWAYFAYEFAAIPGTLFCGWLSDKIFNGRRAIPTILFMALDLAPKNAAGTAAGLTGFFGYFFGTAILANIVMVYVAESAGWDWTFVLLIAACALSIVFMAFTYKEEQYLAKNHK